MKKYKNEELAQEVVTGREERTIGIEIEFFGCHKDSVVERLNARGIQVAWMHYTHNVMDTWKLVYDASVTSTGTGVGHGLELVSPPLKTAEMKRQLEIVCEVLNELGAKVDKTCGVHVHHDVEDLTVENFKTLYRLYDKHSEHIDGIMPLSRRRAYQSDFGTRYCRPISESQLEGLANATSVSDIRNVMHSRYCVINFNSYVKYGTIEFRQHSGSTDFAKLYNWIKITQQMVATSTQKKNVRPLSETAKKRATEAFLNEFKLGFTVEGIYTRDRKDELKRKYKKVATA